MGRIPTRFLGMVALLSVLLLTPGFSGSALAEDQQVTGVVSGVQDYVVTVDGVEYLVVATSRLEGADHANLQDLEGRQVQISYTEYNGDKRVIELVVS